MKIEIVECPVCHKLVILDLGSLPDHHCSGSERVMSVDYPRVLVAEVDDRR